MLLYVSVNNCPTESNWSNGIFSLFKHWNVMGESFASAAWDSFMLPTTEWFKAKVYVCVCMLVFVWLCVHLLHSATHTSMYAINDAKLFTYIEYLSCVDVPSQLCRPTQRLRNMKMLLHSLSLWTASYKQAHIDTSATCMPTCVNTCVHTNTSTLLQIFYVWTNII